MAIMDRDSQRPLLQTRIARNVVKFLLATIIKAYHTSATIDGRRKVTVITKGTTQNVRMVTFDDKALAKKCQLSEMTHNKSYREEYRCLRNNVARHVLSLPKGGGMNRGSVDEYVEAIRERYQRCSRTGENLV